MFLRNRQTFNSFSANSQTTNNTHTNNGFTNSSNTSRQQQTSSFNDTLNSFINNVQGFVSTNLGSVLNPGPVPCPPPPQPTPSNPRENSSNPNSSSSSSSSSTSSQNFNTMFNIFTEQIPNVFSQFTVDPETNSQTNEFQSQSGFTTNTTQQQSQSEQQNQQTQAQANIKRRASLSDLKSIEDIDNLNIRQIKEILANNFVEYKGCCERHELLEKLKRLYTSHYENKRREQEINDTATKSNSKLNFEETDVCKICMESIMDCVLLECGHMCSCIKCGKQLAECPMCRQNVVRVVRVFKS